ncbi:hypothetical protein C4D60_Mb05t13380 [Musa balbisiana]|uniref:Uncharacterized protein n=1 Tax=Musa balbisiana TaxID=52838 RepID=A0A4V4H862_MUSBA|nr:hypothetical protein C4D60_Mb05t13380 [Musa balbisiana]
MTVYRYPDSQSFRLLFLMACMEHSTARTFSASVAETFEFRRKTTQSNLRVQMPAAVSSYRTCGISILLFLINSVDILYAAAWS